MALALFAFSPGMVASSSLAGPQIFAAWGAFGLIFTALATALHIPRGGRSVLPWLIAALVLYLMVLIVTFAVNVPLNNEGIRPIAVGTLSFEMYF